jgi:hypothetical protein
MQQSKCCSDLCASEERAALYAGMSESMSASDRIPFQLLAWKLTNSGRVRCGSHFGR